MSVPATLLYLKLLVIRNCKSGRPAQNQVSAFEKLNAPGVGCDMVIIVLLLIFQLNFHDSPSGLWTLATVVKKQVHISV